MGIKQAIAQVKQLHKKIVAETYEGICTISELKNIKDPITKITKKGSVILYSEIPCRLSVQLSPSVTSVGEYLKPTQTVKLFLETEIKVPEGSKIVVTQNGITTEYKRSGVPVVYATHQEIELEIRKEWV